MHQKTVEPPIFGRPWDGRGPRGKDRKRRRVTSYDSSNSKPSSQQQGAMQLLAREPEADKPDAPGRGCHTFVEMVLPSVTAVVCLPPPPVLTPAVALVVLVRDAAFGCNRCVSSQRGGGAVADGAPPRVRKSENPYVPLLQFNWSAVSWVSCCSYLRGALHIL